MKTIIIGLALASLIARAWAADTYEMSRDEVARLPQDKVQAVRRDCARTWGDDFSMRIYCENKGFRALKVYVERNGQPDGESR